MRVQFFHVKDKLLMTARAKFPLPAPHGELQLFPDFSKFTLQLRRQLNPITKGLHNRKILLKWRYPATLLVSRNGASHVINNLKSGMQLLHTWGIIPNPSLVTTLPLEQRGHHSSHREQE